MVFNAPASGKVLQKRFKIPPPLISGDPLIRGVKDVPANMSPLTRGMPSGRGIFIPDSDFFLDSIPLFFYISKSQKDSPGFPDPEKI